MINNNKNCSTSKSISSNQLETNQGAEAETEAKKSKFNDLDVCCICLDKFTWPALPPFKTECSHYLHKKCLHSWLVVHRNSTCPMCKVRFTHEFINDLQTNEFWLGRLDAIDEDVITQTGHKTFVDNIKIILNDNDKILTESQLNEMMLFAMQGAGFSINASDEEQYNFINIFEVAQKQGGVLSSEHANEGLRFFYCKDKFIYKTKWIEILRKMGAALNIEAVREDFKLAICNTNENSLDKVKLCFQVGVELSQTELNEALIKVINNQSPHSLSIARLLVEKQPRFPFEILKEKFEWHLDNISKETYKMLNFLLGIFEDSKQLQLDKKLHRIITQPTTFTQPITFDTYKIPQLLFSHGATLTEDQRNEIFTNIVNITSLNSDHTLFIEEVLPLLIEMGAKLNFAERTQVINNFLNKEHKHYSEVKRIELLFKLSSWLNDKEANQVRKLLYSKSYNELDKMILTILFKMVEKPAKYEVKNELNEVLNATFKDGSVFIYAVHWAELLHKLGGELTQIQLQRIFYDYIYKDHIVWKTEIINLFFELGGKLTPEELNDALHQTISDTKHKMNQYDVANILFEQGARLTTAQLNSALLYITNKSLKLFDEADINQGIPLLLKMGAKLSVETREDLITNFIQQEQQSLQLKRIRNLFTLDPKFNPEERKRIKQLLRDHTSPIEQQVLKILFIINGEAPTNEKQQKELDAILYTCYSKSIYNTHWSPLLYKIGGRLTLEQLKTVFFTYLTQQKDSFFCSFVHLFHQLGGTLTTNDLNKALMIALNNPKHVDYDVVEILITKGAKLSKEQIDETLLNLINLPTVDSHFRMHTRYDEHMTKGIDFLRSKGATLTIEKFKQAINSLLNKQDKSHLDLKLIEALFKFDIQLDIPYLNNAMRVAAKCFDFSTVTMLSFFQSQGGNSQKDELTEIITLALEDVNCHTGDILKHLFETNVCLGQTELDDVLAYAQENISSAPNYMGNIIKTLGERF